jgi:hypothetical protein
MSRNDYPPPEKPPPLPASIGFVAFLFLLFFGWVAFTCVSNLFRIIIVGKICYSRSGCKTWSADTWAMLFDTVWHLMLLVVMALLIVGAIQALGKIASGK